MSLLLLLATLSPVAHAGLSGLVVDTQAGLRSKKRAELVQTALHSQRDAVAACFRPWLDQSPGSAGALNLSFSVERSGELTLNGSVSVRDPAPTTACLQDLVQAAQGPVAESPIQAYVPPPAPWILRLRGTLVLDPDLLPTPPATPRVTEGPCRIPEGVYRAGAGPEAVDQEAELASFVDPAPEFGTPLRDWRCAPSDGGEAVLMRTIGGVDYWARNQWRDGWYGFVDGIAVCAVINYGSKAHILRRTREALGPGPDGDAAWRGEENMAWVGPTREGLRFVVADRRLIEDGPDYPDPGGSGPDACAEAKANEQARRQRQIEQASARLAGATTREEVAGRLVEATDLLCRNESAQLHVLAARAVELERLSRNGTLDRSAQDRILRDLRGHVVCTGDATWTTASDTLTRQAVVAGTPATLTVRLSELPPPVASRESWTVAGVASVKRSSRSPHSFEVELRPVWAAGTTPQLQRPTVWSSWSQTEASRLLR